ncbi:hypothetical protein BG258_10620 [Lysinibacillus fusiformis]|uniref:Uncharacterized protein n=2 Tax=Bacillaceae TaxID=186817 RepID=A0A1E4R769_9BACI|nr:hypothetical protein BG258_10620 [Lysinibacillus fusiformis]
MKEKLDDNWGNEEKSAENEADIKALMDSAVWSAAIHYNTDNLYVHIATVEPIPTRVKKWTMNLETGKWEEQVRAKRKQGSLDKMKSKVANLIMDRTKERNLVTDLIRGSVNLKKEKRFIYTPPNKKIISKSTSTITFRLFSMEVRLSVYR